MFEFPEKPQIKIPNYIINLNDRVKIICKSNNTLLALHKRNFGSFKEGARKLKLSESAYKKYLTQRFPPSFIKSFSAITNTPNLSDKIFLSELNFVNKKIIVRLPKMLNPKLAYFIGYLQGDGYMTSTGKRLGFTDESLEHIEFMSRLSSEIFGKYGRIREQIQPKTKKPYYFSEINQISIVQFLHKVFGLPLGKKDRLYIPELIRRNKILLRWYLVGIFDADGTLPKNPDKVVQYFIDIALKNRQFVEDLRRALLSFGIQTLEPYERKAKSPYAEKETITWELRIRKQDMLRKFLNEIGFVYKDKVRRANELSLLLRP